MRIRTAIIILLLAAGSLLGIGPIATAAATPAPYGPPLPLLSNCGRLQPADAAIAVDGTIRGFASCGAAELPPISFVRYRGGIPFSHPTPYRGWVLKVAWDGLNSTYLLFVRPGPNPNTEQLFIGKQLDNTGQYAPATLLATTHSGGLKNYLRPIHGALVASNGGWWAVWDEPTLELGGRLTYSLFQRHTMLGVQPRTRMTYPMVGADDSAPSLAYSPGLLTAVWAREPASGGAARLTLGLSHGSGWTARPLSVTMPENSPIATDLISYVGVRYLAWGNFETIAVASNILGPFYPHRFAVVNAGDPKVAVSGQNLYLMWSTYPSFGGSEVMLAERAAGSWSTVVLPGATSAARVLAQGGKGRLLYWAAGTLMLRVQI